MFRNKVLPALLCVGLGSAGVAQAASVEYYMNQSNELSLADNVNNYLKVTIDDEGLTGYINFTVNVLPALSSLATGSFGIDKFGFNVVSGTLPATGTWSLPVGWAAEVAPPTIGQDGFGKFEAVVSTSGAADRQSSLQFSFLSSALPESFAELSTNNAGEGNVYFAAHVAGFNDGFVTSAFFGGSELVPVPVPAPLVLLASALVPLFRLRKRQK